MERSQVTAVDGGKQPLKTLCHSLILLLQFQEWRQPVCLLYNPQEKTNYELQPARFSTASQDQKEINNTKKYIEYILHYR